MPHYWKQAIRTAFAFTALIIMALSVRHISFREGFTKGYEQREMISVSQVKEAYRIGFANGMQRCRKTVTPVVAQRESWFEDSIVGHRDSALYCLHMGTLEPEY